MKNQKPARKKKNNNSYVLMVHSLLFDKNLDQVHVLAWDYEENYHQEQNHFVYKKKRKEKGVDEKSTVRTVYKGRD